MTKTIACCKFKSKFRYGRGALNLRCADWSGILRYKWLCVAEQNSSFCSFSVMSAVNWALLSLWWKMTQLSSSTFARFRRPIIADYIGMPDKWEIWCSHVPCIAKWNQQDLAMTTRTICRWLLNFKSCSFRCCPLQLQQLKMTEFYLENESAWRHWIFLTFLLLPSTPFKVI